MKALDAIARYAAGPSTPPGQAPRFRGRHAAALGIAANIASALPAGYNGDEAFYAQLQTPPGSPPGWAFAPAWAINNTLTLAGDLHLANLPARTPGRRAVLTSEAITWALFASFSGLYFGLRSPVLGAANTTIAPATTAHAVATSRHLDHRAAWLFTPRLAWLTYATYVSVGTALHSPDRLLNLRPAQTR